MPINFSDYDEAFKRAKERSMLPDGQDAALEDLLLLSAGTARGDPNLTVYRPYYCAAKMLDQSLREQRFKEADGAKFTGQAVPIASLYDLQRSLDYSLLVPDGFEVPGNSASIAQLKAARDAALAFMTEFQPRGVLM